MLENTMLFSLSANEELANKISEILGVPLSERIIYKFPSGERLIEPVPTVRGKRIFIIQSTCPPVNDNLMDALIFTDACRRASAGEINFVVPYFGYSRQDRKAKPRQPITSALVAKLIDAAGVDRVITVNLHAAQEQGFFSCLVDDLTAVPLLAQYLYESGKDMSEGIIVSPDHGGVNRARDLAEPFNAPIAIIDKRRNSKLQPECMNIIGDVAGKNCYMVDDMIDTGKSACIGARALRDAGAKSVSILAIHPVFSDPCYDLLKEGVFDEVVVTDSIPLSQRFRELPFIKVITLSGLLSETIQRVVDNKPLSESSYALFNGKLRFTTRQ